MVDSFILPHEKILLMDLPNQDYEYEKRPMALDDLKKCREVGIETAFQFIWWNKIETAPGVYDWTMVEEAINRVMSADMKLILFLYEMPPQFYPDDWYLIQDSGHRITHLSLWNPEAQAKEHEFIKMFCERYVSDKIHIANSLQRDGETMLPIVPCVRGSHAIKSYQERYGTSEITGDNPNTLEWLKESVLNTLIEHQNIFLSYNHHRDIWGAYHKKIHSKWCGTSFIDSLYQKYREVYTDTVNINVIQFTYIPHGHSFYSEIKRDIEKFGLNVWGGSEYCEGLPSASPIAKEFKLRGLVTAPIHPFVPHRTIEPWMIENFKNAINLLSN